MVEESRSRVRYDEAFWRAHHEAWRRSELNQREYCEAQGIPLKAFGNWRAKFRAEPQLPARKMLYRRGGLSHTLSHGLSDGLSHDLGPTIPPARGPMVPPAVRIKRRRAAQSWPTIAKARNQIGLEVVEQIKGLVVHAIRRQPPAKSILRASHRRSARKYDLHDSSSPHFWGMAVTVRFQIGAKWLHLQYCGAHLRRRGRAWPPRRDVRRARVFA